MCQIREPWWFFQWGGQGQKNYPLRGVYSYTAIFLIYLPYYKEKISVHFSKWTYTVDIHFVENNNLFSLDYSYIYECQISSLIF